MEKTTEMDDLGVPLLQETSNSRVCIVRKDISSHMKCLCPRLMGSCSVISAMAANPHLFYVYICTYICVWYGMVWYGMAWHGMAWYGMAWHGMVWYVCVCVYI